MGSELMIKIFLTSGFVSLVSGLLCAGTPKDSGFCFVMAIVFLIGCSSVFISILGLIWL